MYYTLGLPHPPPPPPVLSYWSAPSSLRDIAGVAMEVISFARTSRPDPHLSFEFGGEGGVGGGGGWGMGRTGYAPSCQ